MSLSPLDKTPKESERKSSLLGHSVIGFSGVVIIVGSLRLLYSERNVHHVGLAVVARPIKGRTQVPDITFVKKFS